MAVVSNANNQSCIVLFVLSQFRLPVSQSRLLAGVEGVEPSLTEPESAVLPLDDTPVLKPALRAPNGRKS